MAIYIEHTLKPLEEASTATEIGPTLTTADCRSPSLPLEMEMEPDMVAPHPLCL